MPDYSNDKRMEKKRGEEKLKERKKRTKKSAMQKGQTPFIIVMLALPVLQWLVFFLYVNINTILLAFKDARTGEWSLVNFKDFWEQLTSPYGEIGIAVLNSARYFVLGLIIAMLCMWVAYFFYKKIFGHRFFRIIFYLPAVISSVAMVTAYKSIITPGGPLDKLVSLIGVRLPPEGLLANSATATYAIMGYCVLTGFTTNVLLFSSAMSRIPIEMLEAAALEGCGPTREFFSLIVPMIWSTISSVVILAFTSILSTSGPVLLFTNGYYDTTTIPFWIFSKVYGNGAIGGVAASYNLVSCVGLCFTLVSVPIILGVRKLMNKIPDVEY